MHYVCPSVRLFVCLSVAKSEKPFSQKLSNLVLWCLLTSYRKSYRVLPLGEFTVMISEPHATLQGQSPCEISVMIVPHCRVLPLGEFTVMISEPHATLQGLSPCEISVMIVPHCRCKNSIHHIENRFSSYFIFCFIFNAVWALTSGGFRIISDTLVTLAIIT